MHLHVFLGCGTTIFDVVDPRSSQIICNYYRLKENKYESINKLLMEENKNLQEKVKFYETTIQLHPDGQQILDLKDDFFKK